VDVIQLKLTLINVFIWWLINPHTIAEIMIYDPQVLLKFSHLKQFFLICCNSVGWATGRRSGL